ncbi:uncharacterized protein [Diadema setosum]|uniref:uncharacterized protein n=1 Tax=Diadema setosum TaxID=31175 RepID=UPI003B3BB72C
MTTLFTVIIFKGMAVLFLLHMGHGRTLPGPTERQQRGRTLHPCPERCSCFNHTVVCNSLQLSTVPGKLPAETRVLYLNDNSIKNIDFDAISKLRELEELHVQGNQIKGLHRHSIASFQKLRVLDLRHNPLVCDCNLASLASSKLRPVTGAKLRLDETQCALPLKYAGRSVCEVLEGLRCEKREKRFADEECYPGFCWNEGECVERPEGPSCICPPLTTGWRCEIRVGTSHLRESDEDEGEVTITIYKREVTHDTIDVYWNMQPEKQGAYYMLYLQRDDASSDEEEIYRSGSSQHTFTDLLPGTRYSLCVEAFSHYWDGPFTKKCKSMKTRPQPHPQPGHPPTRPEPGTSPHYPSKKPDDSELLHHAAVILGSVIGVCAFLIIFLTLGYKFRTLRHRQSSSSESSTASPTATTTETVPDTVNPTNNPAHEIIVLSVPSADSGTASGEVGASDPEEALEAAAAAPAPNPIAINNVLQALKQQDVCRQQGAASANALVLYRSGPESNSAADGTFPEPHPSSNGPIYIVSNGTRYPIDPALSDVLRSAISGTGGHVPPIPDEPPPPYSERDEALPPPPIDSGAVGEESSNRDCEPVYTSEAESPNDVS